MARFDHQNTDFSLAGVHTQITCADCHVFSDQLGIDSQRGDTPLDLFTQYYSFALTRIKELRPKFKKADYSELFEETSECLGVKTIYNGFEDIISSKSKFTIDRNYLHTTIEKRWNQIYAYRHKSHYNYPVLPFLLLKVLSKKPYSTSFIYAMLGFMSFQVTP